MTPLASKEDCAETSERQVVWLRLTPSKQLHLSTVNDSGPLAPICKAFENDWREGLFALAADKALVVNFPSLRYWQELASRYITALCHCSDAETSFCVDVPLPEDFADSVVRAPPMEGGEYLSVPALQHIWEALDSWVHEAVAKMASLGAFLKTKAPLWQPVGKVCFHLAENKNDLEHPFAFLVTYTTGFGPSGQVRHVPLARALEQCSGSQNRAALIKLLKPIDRASQALLWVKDLVRTGDIYRPLLLSVRDGYRFLCSVAALEAAGLSVRLPNWWKKRPRPRVTVKIGEKRKGVLSVDGMLDFDVSVALEDESLSPEELRVLLNSDERLVFLKGQWVEVDRSKLQEAIDHWKALKSCHPDGKISFVEGMRLLSGAPANLKSDDEAENRRQWQFVSAGKELREMLHALRHPSPGDAIDGLSATLRPYQSEGVSWLAFLSKLGLGACLADDMGLGKTIQVLALLLKLRADGPQNPSLLVVPASLLGNWRKESERFAPSLRLAFVHSSEASREQIDRLADSPMALDEVDLVVTTYNMVAKQHWLSQRKWHLIILDEAQAIRNESTLQSRAVKKLSAFSRITLTGTPIENRLSDLWSIFDFLNPGLLGSASVFKTFVGAMQGSSEDQYAPLRKLVSPYILRRMKTDPKIITDLPNKIETPCYCHLTKDQVRLYQHLVDALAEELKASKCDGMARRGLVLRALLQLKQVCNHPSQLSGDGDFSPEKSGKFLRLAELCEELSERQEKVLVFTQFRLNARSETTRHVYLCQSSEGSFMADSRLGDVPCGAERHDGGRALCQTRSFDDRHYQRRPWRERLPSR